jgi:hypothetical protein
MKGMFYRLDENHNPVEVGLSGLDDLWRNPEKRIVRQDTLPGDILVSTVFLGINHAFGDGPPILFETMIFGGVHDGYQARYQTWQQALSGHDETLALVQDLQIET